MRRYCYHHDDEDGWMSAAILKRLFPETQFKALHHGDDYELVTEYDEVYVLDYAFTDEEFSTLKQTNDTVVWIDHHKSAIDAVKLDIEGIRDSSRAACALTWTYLNPGLDIPRSILHIEDVDLWNYELENTRAFFSYIQSKIEPDEEVEFMESLLDNEPLDYNQMYAIGSAISEFELKSVCKTARKGVKRTLFDGVSCVVYFASRGVSLLGNEALGLFDDVDVAVMIRLIEREDGSIRYNYSLRSRKEDGVDVSAIAKRYGGGGHRSAAGFVTDKLIL